MQDRRSGEMRTKRSAVILAALLAVLVLAASGCGGGGGSNASSTEAADTTSVETDTTATETDTEETTETETDATETDAMATDTDATATQTDATDTDMAGTTSDEDSSTVDTSAVASADDCRDLGNLSTELGNAFGGTPSSDTKKYAEFMQAFADRAPEEIRDDFQVIADFYEKWVDAMGDADFSSGKTPTPEQLSKLMDVVKNIDQAKLTAASTNIATWVTQNCVPGATGG